MDDITTIREIATNHGRVYQPAGWGRSTIDWTPPAPLAGHRTLTRGTPKEHPTQGPIVQFREKSGSQTICVRIAPDRGALVELVAIAEGMDAEIRAEREAADAIRKAELEARIAADVAAFEATLPDGYAAIDEVNNNPGAADGWGMTTYRHSGCELTSAEVRELAPRLHSPIGDAYQLIVYVPADGLAALVERKRADAAAKDEARAAKRAADDEARAAKIALARESGRPVELARWTEPCNGSACECSLDILTRYTQPDGTTTVRRSHTH